MLISSLILDMITQKVINLGLKNLVFGNTFIWKRTRGLFLGDLLTFNFKINVSPFVFLLFGIGSLNMLLLA